MKTTSRKIAFLALFFSLAGVSTADASHRFEGTSKDGLVQVQAYQTGFLITGRELTIRVTNNSPKTISTNPSFTQFFVVAESGEQYEMKHPFYSSRGSIKPKGKYTFRVRSTHRQIRWENVREILCLFELGDFRVILKPESKPVKKETPSESSPKIRPPASVSAKKSRVADIATGLTAANYTSGNKK